MPHNRKITRLKCKYCSLICRWWFLFCSIRRCTWTFARVEGTLFV